MKSLLIAYSAALLSLLCFGNWRRYRLASAFLGLALLSAALLNFPLPSWYPYLMGVTAFFRLLAGLEVLHRQTYPFYLWGRLNGPAWILAGMFTAVCWLMRSDAGGSEFLDARRLSQIWLAFVFLAVDAIWIGLGGPWYRRADLIAGAFGVMALNHGVSSVLAFSGRWRDWGRWWDAQVWIWGIDSSVFLLLAVLFSGFPVWQRFFQAIGALLRVVRGFPENRS